MANSPQQLTLAHRLALRLPSLRIHNSCYYTVLHPRIAFLALSENLFDSLLVPLEAAPQCFQVEQHLSLIANGFGERPRRYSPPEDIVRSYNIKYRYENMGYSWSSLAQRNLCL